jgi:hypothetical protein
MKKTSAVKTAPPENAITPTGFGTVDYCDSYRITKSTGENIGEITNQIFKAPKWVNGLMRIRDLLVGPFGLKTAKEANPDKIFPIIAQNENEIIMGINDVHLNFRVSVLVNREKSYIYATTLVHYNNGWGKAYFLLIKPFHQIIVRSLMKRLLKD